MFLAHAVPASRAVASCRAPARAERRERGLMRLRSLRSLRTPGVTVLARCARRPRGRFPTLAGLDAPPAPFRLPPPGGLRPLFRLRAPCGRLGVACGPAALGDRGFAPRSSPAPGGAFRSRRSLRALLPHDGGSPRLRAARLGPGAPLGAAARRPCGPLPCPTLADARRSLRARRHHRRGSLLGSLRSPPAPPLRAFSPAGQPPAARP